MLTWMTVWYSVFHWFRQAKVANGGWVDFKLEPIFATVSVASKNDARNKSGQNLLKNSHPTTLIEIGETDCIRLEPIFYAFPRCLK
jgi:hypothetical protein